MKNASMREHRGARGEDRARRASRRRDRLMICGERLAPVLAEVLADAVVDDDGVVDRVADDREHRGDGRERDLLARDDQAPRTMHASWTQGDDAAGREAQIEAERDVDHDEDDGDARRSSRAASRSCLPAFGPTHSTRSACSGTVSAPSSARRPSMSWSPLRLSWISTLWSRGFTTCGFLAPARSSTPATPASCSLDPLEIGLGLVADAILSPPGLNFTSVAASVRRAARSAGAVALGDEAERVADRAFCSSRRGR